jgi:mitochondrial fission protein ELM1
MSDESVPVWVLADDRAGNVSQALGVAEALALPFAVKTIRYDRWAKLPNLLRGAGLIGIEAESRTALVPPWPRLVIAAGRRTAPVARWIKRQCGARLVQIMDPGGPGRDDFDLIAIPAHDRPRPAANVLEIIGAPHRVGPARLTEEAKRWESAFAALPRPWIAVIVGGATRQRPFPVDMAEDLGRRVAALAAAAHGSVLLTTSRRTGAAQSQALAAALPEPRWLHLYGQPGDNPYFGFLALADAIVVTGDSVSMCCEACAAPAPVFIWSPPGWVAPKHERLHTLLYQRGLARPLDSVADLSPWDRPRLDAAGDIAAALRRLPDVASAPQT